jgi:uncharacterized paraquat-inducible protein A
MCKDCKTKMKARYEGTRMILEREPCNCEHCDTVEFEDVPRCVNCGHKLDVKLTDDASFWERNPPWLDEDRDMVTRSLEKA